MKTTTAVATDVDLAATLARHEVLLQQILLAVQALQSSRVPLSRHDTERLGKILPVCGGTFGDQSFTSRDVTDSRAPGLRLVCRGLSSKQLGRLFMRGEGVPIAGFVVERVGVEINVVLWRVSAC